MATVHVNADGINLNASHYGAMSVEEGPKRILQDHHHLPFDEAWAKKAHSLCIEAVTPKAEEKAEAHVKSEAKPKRAAQ